MLVNELNLYENAAFKAFITDIAVNTSDLSMLSTIISAQERDQIKV